MQNYFETIINELKQSKPEISDALLKIIHNSSNVFVSGAGRSKLAIQAFGMRLSQMDKHAYVVGETTTPAIKAKDVLILASGSGETVPIIAQAKKAKALNAKVVLLTTNNQSTLAQLSDVVITLGGKGKFATDNNTVQPMGALFEQSVWIYGDAIVLKYMHQYHISEQTMQNKHANL